MTRPDLAFDLPPERTIRSARVFEAPRTALWALFENPDYLGVWWGPSGFTNHFETFEFRSGGSWRLVMRGPDGSEYAMEKVFVAVDAPALIVMDHVDDVHGFRMFMTFNEVHSGTEIEWIMVFDHADEAAKVRPFIEPANEQNFNRLNALLQ
jgi:uncharacterized protein YndB with AHSA1/START domain